MPVGVGQEVHNHLPQSPCVAHDRQRLRGEVDLEGLSLVLKQRVDRLWRVGDDRAQVEELAAKVQEATEDSVQVAFVDQGYTGEDAERAADGWGIQLQVVKLPEARKGFVLLPKRWLVERDVAWLSRFRRLAKEYERVPETLAGLHLVAFATLMLGRMLKLLMQGSA